MRPAAILFDLYGTLVDAGERPLSRRLPAALGVPRSAWMSLLRGGLLTTAFGDDEAFVACVIRSLSPPGDDAADVCRGLLRAELDAVALAPGAATLLNFLKRRGHRLGLVSNLASPFKEPVRRFGLEPLFDAVAFSCDEGCTKPDPEIYRRALARLGVEPSEALFVGDSFPNDVKAPAALGMKTAGVGAAGGDVTLARAAGLGLLDLASPRYAPLLAVGDRIRVGDAGFAVEAVEPVADGEQGRYNLVYRIEGRGDAGPARLYAKRFLLPETAHLEAFAYELQRRTGLPACTATLHPVSEPLLLLSEAPGEKFDGRLSEGVARSLGAHFVFALLFSNADIRPRNAFVSGDAVTLIDLEHCFFNLAIGTEGLANAERPETFDRMPKDELSRRVKKTVLSPRATSRARRAFFGDTPRGSPVDAAFREGFLSFYAAQNARADSLVDTLLARVHAEPPLVIGTHGYRRAMAEVDVEDIRARLVRDPEAALEATW